MRVILDTNVFVSAVFFGGIPLSIVDKWRAGGFTLVVTEEILAEYRIVCDRLTSRFRGLDPRPHLEMVEVNAEMYTAIPILETVSADPDDDKFIACALACNGKLIVSGDKHLLDVNGYRGIEVLKPREFADRYL